MRVKLTTAFVESVKSPDIGQVDYFDARCPGLALRLSQGGHKAWSVLYRINGRLRRLTLGSCPPIGLADARTLATRALRDAALGIDPASAKKTARTAETFGELAALYLERHAIGKKSRDEDERIIEHDLLPAWRNTKAREITRRDVVALLDKVVARGAPVMANRTKALISKIFNFAIGRSLLEANPAYKVPSPGGEEQHRDRVLSEDEIRAIWGALADESAKVADIFKLALLTAQRRGEVLGMRWNELDLDAGWWTLPADRTKNRLTHRVPLVGHALAILRARKELPHDEVFVFRGGRRNQPIANVQKPLASIKKASGVDFKVHDLRRTAASHMTGIGITRLVVSKLLNHVEQGVTAVYDRHSYDLEKRAALVKWDARIAAILTERRGKVVNLR